MALLRVPAPSCGPYARPNEAVASTRLDPPTRPPATQIKELFLESYSKKHPESTLVAATVHVVAADGRALPDAAVTSAFVSEHDDVVIGVGPPPERAAPPRLPPPPSTAGAEGGGGNIAVSGGGSAAAAADTGTLLCRNYGCQKRFREEDNGEGACRHHTGPPMFRDGACGFAVCGVQRAGAPVRSRWSAWCCLSAVTLHRSSLRRQEGVVVLPHPRRVRVGRLHARRRLRQ